MMTYILFAAGFLFLIKGADFLVNGASRIAKILKVSDLVIGLTIVAFGTSAPELFVNIFASAGGDTGIAIGNILGSNIFNILLILGVSAIIYPLKVGQNTVWKEIPLTLLAAVLIGILANDKFIDNAGSSALTRIDGLILLLFFIIFLYYTFGITNQLEIFDAARSVEEHSLKKPVFLVIAGLLCLLLGSRWVVSGAVKLASSLGISESVIGLTIVATGTSLPELATSVVAACKKNADIAVGNIVGSNIFNIFFILGISSIINPLPFQARDNMDIGVTIISSLLLFICMFTGRKRVLDRWEGFVFVFIYITYVIFLIIRM
ncbi:MAG: calcium/sodium antiporter [Phycisphaerae bacterium]|nr:calcium/sodium antiporter [Phycisphaerae bacterium]